MSKLGRNFRRFDGLALSMVALLTFFALIVSTTPIDASGPGVVIRDFGIRSCGVWLEVRTTRNEPPYDVRFVQAREWISGFLSAHNWYLKPQQGDVAYNTDREGIYGWLDGYCRENPTAGFIKAIVGLVEYLESR